LTLPLQLARLRARHTAVLDGGDVDAIARAAQALGRRLVEIQMPRGRAFTLAWVDGYEPPVGEGGIPVRRLSPIPTLTFACCLGLCWPDASAPPFPGEPTTVAAVVQTTTAIGADDRHVKGALRSHLRAAGLIHLHGGDLRLGPAVAGWAPAQVEALRRYHNALPKADASHAI
jgi:hypothetical protein